MKWEGCVFCTRGTSSSIIGSSFSGRHGFTRSIDVVVAAGRADVVAACRARGAALVFAGVGRMDLHSYYFTKLGGSRAGFRRHGPQCIAAIHEADLPAPVLLPAVPGLRRGCGGLHRLGRRSFSAASGSATTLANSVCHGLTPVPSLAEQVSVLAAVYHSVSYSLSFCSAAGRL